MGKAWGGSSSVWGMGSFPCPPLDLSLNVWVLSKIFRAMKLGQSFNRMILCKNCCGARDLHEGMLVILCAHAQQAVINRGVQLHLSLQKEIIISQSPF